MPNTYFQFQQFRIRQEHAGMKVTTDACLFGAWVSHELAQHPASPKILDIGTGTGLLALMIAQKVPSAQIDAVEIDPKAADEARLNISASPWNPRISLYNTPIQAYHPGHTYDVIVCNPPFFHASIKGLNTSKNTALHATHLPSHELLQSVTSLLSEKGSLFLLYPEQEMRSFSQIAADQGFHLAKMVHVHNTATAPVFRKMARFSFTQQDACSQKLCIRRPDGKYSDEFWSLLKAYYLPYNAPDA